MYFIKAKFSRFVNINSIRNSGITVRTLDIDLRSDIRVCDVSVHGAGQQHFLQADSRSRLRIGHNYTLRTLRARINGQGLCACISAALGQTANEIAGKGSFGSAGGQGAIEEIPIASQLGGSGCGNTAGRNLDARNFIAQVIHRNRALSVGSSGGQGNACGAASLVANGQFGEGTTSGGQGSRAVRHAPSRNFDARGGAIGIGAGVKGCCVGRCDGSADLQRFGGVGEVDRCGRRDGFWRNTLCQNASQHILQRLARGRNSGALVPIQALLNPFRLNHFVQDARLPSPVLYYPSHKY